MPTLVALGAFLARRGFLAKTSIGICMLTVIGGIVLGAVLAARGASSPSHDVPIVASSALAWGGAFLLAFSASAHALRSDRAAGIVDLVRTRARAGAHDYLLMRVGGLAALLFGLVGGGTLVVGAVVAILVAGQGGAGRVAGTTLASIVYALAFSAVVAPMALAALGARSRLGGYGFLLVVLVLPELIASVSGLPASLREVLSVPGALATLRAALIPGRLDAARAGNALAVLVTVSAVTTWLVRRASVVVANEATS